jgi:replicative DNA helicase
MISHLEAEQALLGVLITRPDELLRATDIIGPGDLYREGHRAIFNAILDLYQLGEPVELLSVKERLEERGELEVAGGQTYLMELTEASFTAANVSYHCRLIKDAAINRRVKRWAQGLVSQAAEGIPDTRAWLSEVEGGLLEIAEAVREKASPHAQDIIREVRNTRRDIQQGKAPSIPCDDKLKGAIPGLYPGHVWAIGGYTSTGKSTFLAQNIVDQLDAAAPPPLIFSTEDSRADKIIKLTANLAGVSQRRLLEGDVDGIEDRVKAAEDRLAAWGPIIYDDVYSVDEMRLKAKKHRMRDGISVIALDYIQLIQGPGGLYERLADGITKLQKLAKELQVTVIFLSQVSNEAMREDSNLIGLKGAGELAAAPDIVLWLKRNKENESFLDCEVRKNRPFGQTGVIRMRFTDSWSRIERRL